MEGTLHFIHFGPLNNLLRKMDLVCQRALPRLEAEKENDFKTIFSFDEGTAAFINGS